MPLQRVPVGSVRIVGSTRIDRTRVIEFEGDKLAVREKTIDVEGMTGFTETLYYTTDHRLIVHVANWSKYPSEMVTHSVLEIDRQDLQPGGRFAELGLAAWAWLRKK